MDLSKEFMHKLFAAKIYQEVSHIDGWYNEHGIFLKENQSFVNISITDKTFKNRIDLASSAFENWLIS